MDIFVKCCTIYCILSHTEWQYLNMQKSMHSSDLTLRTSTLCLSSCSSFILSWMMYWTSDWVTTRTFWWRNMEETRESFTNDPGEQDELLGSAAASELNSQLKQDFIAKGNLSRWVKLSLVSRCALLLLRWCCGLCALWRYTARRHTSGQSDRTAPGPSRAGGRSSCPGGPSRPPACVSWTWTTHNEAWRAFRSSKPGTWGTTSRPCCGGPRRNRKKIHAACRGTAWAPGAGAGARDSHRGGYVSARAAAWR